MSEKELLIASYREKMSRVDTSNIQGQKIYQYCLGQIKVLEKQNVKLHVEIGPTCDGCQ